MTSQVLIIDKWVINTCAEQSNEIMSSVSLSYMFLTNEFAFVLPKKEKAKTNSANRLTVPPLETQPSHHFILIPTLDDTVKGFFEIITCHNIYEWVQHGVEYQK